MNEKRCEECHGELSYCGEMTVDGPALDCRYCILEDKYSYLKEEHENLLNILEKEEQKPIPIGKCSYCNTPHYATFGFCGTCGQSGSTIKNV